MIEEGQQQFTCAVCGGTFAKGWSDEEALAAAVERLGAAILLEPLVAICEVCWELFIAQAPPMRSRERAVKATKTSRTARVRKGQNDD